MIGYWEELRRKDRQKKNLVRKVLDLAFSFNTQEGEMEADDVYASIYEAVLTAASRLNVMGVEPFRSMPNGADTPKSFAVWLGGIKM